MNPTLIETLTDTRAAVFDELRQAHTPDSQLLVLGHWSGHEAEARQIVEKELPPLRVTLALGPQALTGALQGSTLYDLVWLVGADTWLRDPVLCLALCAFTVTKLHPRARLVCVAEHVCELTRSLSSRADAIHLRNLPKVRRYLVTATMNDEPPVEVKSAPLI